MYKKKKMKFNLCEENAKIFQFTQEEIIDFREEI